MRDGVEAQVLVNQRALIDKMLARYSGDYSTFRELIQNADDAGATEICIEFSSKQTSRNPEKIAGLEEIRLSNNGRAFSELDWERISKIAEGNPDEQTVGMFGVGFYSVFSFTEHPLIYSDGIWLAFHWKQDQLCTSRMKESGSTINARLHHHSTHFVFGVRDTTLSFSLSELQQFLSSAMFFSKSLCSIQLLFNDKEICVVRKTRGAKPRTIPMSEEMRVCCLPEKLIQSLLPSLNPQDIPDIQQRLTLGLDSLSVISMSLAVSAGLGKSKVSSKERFIVVQGNFRSNPTEKFASQCHRILKKNIPATTQCSLLFQPQGDTLKEGKIFVGISTHQLTGCRTHLAGHFYPTIHPFRIGKVFPAVLRLLHGTQIPFLRWGLLQSICLGIGL